MTRDSVYSYFRIMIEKFKDLAGLILIFVALAGAFYGVPTFIDKRIDAKLNDPSVTRRIALAARPEMIIDDTGTVLMDHGAMDYLANVEVVKEHKDQFVPDKIIITPRRYMAIAPLVTPVDGSFRTSVNRGSKLDWVVTFDTISFSEAVGHNRIRIEILDR